MQTLRPHPELLNQSLYFHKTPGESFAQQSLRSSALDQVSVTCHEKSFVISITGRFLLPQNFSTISFSRSLAIRVMNHAVCGLSLSLACLQSEKSFFIFFKVIIIGKQK